MQIAVKSVARGATRPPLLPFPPSPTISPLSRLTGSPFITVFSGLSFPDHLTVFCPHWLGPLYSAFFRPYFRILEPRYTRRSLLSLGGSILAVARVRFRLASTLSSYVGNMPGWSSNERSYVRITIGLGELRTSVNWIGRPPIFQPFRPYCDGHI
ncbi:hypothetical protein BV25DRAFT_757111 [Artomyces pyxidatus]|uniref:Uncharacterized protein n=1 Tax=Artomyces pyxidatus TaxID=48021 RepID=A0ACB8SXX2_9AGAM|nr:hypothetical protein BV25DRAFT_757111 [Artomyces pyxidatus]